MGSPFRKMQKNARAFELDSIYRNMTPEQYKEGVRIAVKNAVEDLGKEYNIQMRKMQEEYNHAIREGIMVAMDTLSVELIYELGNVLECYKDEPEYLDQKIDIVQNIYEAAMASIKNYANYKSDTQAQKEFETKKRTVKKVFGIYSDDNRKE